MTNLFVGHNRIHDFSYYLGFTEQNYNLQTDNAGRGGQGGDPEIGNVQAGRHRAAATRTFEGRDNANQIALQDGVPGITNQYLFQPIAGAFYAPCADGALDTGIYGHEYTHAISNRMVGGPDDGLTSEQGGAMGESWGDLERRASTSSRTTTPPAPTPGRSAPTPPATSRRASATTPINDNPLNYGDYGFDTTGAEVHADGEIWNGTQWEVRQALVDKWDAAGFKYNDKALQKQCAEAHRDRDAAQRLGLPGQPPLAAADLRRLAPAARCHRHAPGPRRDARGRPDALRRSQPGRARGGLRPPRHGGRRLHRPGRSDPRPGLDRRDAQLQVGLRQQLRGDLHVDQRGQGLRRRLRGASDPDRRHRRGHAAVRHGHVHAGHLPDDLRLAHQRLPAVHPHRARHRRRLQRSRSTTRQSTWPAAASGATVLGATDGSLNADALIDGTEATNWAGITATDVDDSNPGVMVDLAGGVQTITAAKVSALLHPATARDRAPAARGRRPSVDDPDSGSRFTALRKFALAGLRDRLRRPGQLHDVLHLGRRRLPGRHPAAGGARPDHAHLPVRPGPGRRGPARGAGEPVHRAGQVRR